MLINILINIKNENKHLTQEIRRNYIKRILEDKKQKLVNNKQKKYIIQEFIFKKKRNKSFSSLTKTQGRKLR